MDAWFKPALSLESQASLEIGLRTLDQMPEQQLRHVARDWLAKLHRQQQLINVYARRVQELEITAALSAGTTSDHLAWAAEFRKKAGVSEPLRLRRRSKIIYATAELLERLAFRLSSTS